MGQGRDAGAGSGITIVWLRRALRLADNPALVAALPGGGAVVPIYVDEHDTRWYPGNAARAWLALSLASLDSSLRARGSRLTVIAGPAAQSIPRLASSLGARIVHYDRSAVAEIAGRDDAVTRALAAAGVSARVHECALLRGPEVPLTGAGAPYRVFTPYYNAARSLGGLPALADAPERVSFPDAASALPDGVTPLAPADVARGAAAPPALGSYFTPGEEGALQALERFCARALADYATDRDRPDVAGTSRLSAHLAFGEIAPWRVAARVEAAASEGAAAYVRQLFWREFGAHLLHHLPQTATAPLRPEFEAMPWSDDPMGLAAWTQGRTGYPIVDAGMRELAATGWMHNRVRMLAASFLTKDLLVPWQTGERIFWDRLVDADPGNNVLGWQWVAGSGADAAPYFRVFNPTVQGERFDPDGAYVRTWVPELALLPPRWIHRPWEAPRDVLEGAGVVPGMSYPLPIVDHAEARVRALAAYDAIRAGRR